MALASDLMGLGVSPLQAARTATGGTGPLTITAAGSTYSGSTKLGCCQFVVTSNSATGTSVGLPVIGGDNGVLLADDFCINNQGSSSLFIFASTGVLISGQTSLSSKQTIQQHQTATLYPVSGTYTAALANWIMIVG